MTKDYYKILGVAEFETAENIKIAYRKLARKCHPDVAGDSIEALLRFKEINEAYEILSNNVKKEEYDKALKFYNYNSSFQPKDVNKPSDHTTNPNTSKKKFSFNWEEFISRKQFKNSYKEESLKQPVNGEDIYSIVEINLLESINGTVKTVNMLQTQTCEFCHGRKFVNGTKCSKCDGKGEKISYKKFNVRIPAGVKNNAKIRLAGEGTKGLNGGRNGDLYLTVHIIEPKYQTEGLNIIKTISIAPHQAIFGTKIVVSTLSGNLSVKIPPNTQSGQKIRLAKCGIVQNGNIGDMILTVEIQIPQNLSQEEIDLYRKLEELSAKKMRD